MDTIALFETDWVIKNEKYEKKKFVWVRLTTAMNNMQYILIMTVFFVCLFVILRPDLSHFPRMSNIPVILVCILDVVFTSYMQFLCVTHLRIPVN